MWKEEFDKKFIGKGYAAIGDKAPIDIHWKASPSEVKAFIQSQFEKLIDDLESNPDPSIGHPITIPFWIELKQTQLRKKWL